MDCDEIEEWLLLPSSDISDTEDGNENDEGELEEVTFNQIFSKELERQISCTKCNVYLCMTKTNNCSYKFHVM